MFHFIDSYSGCGFIQISTKKIIKNKNFEKNPCEKKKGKGAKVHARKKRQGGKTFRSEISALSTFRGCEALPRPPTKKMTKNKNLKKIHARKKKARGQKFMREKKRQGGKTLRSEISALSTFRGCGALPRPPTKKMTKNKILKKNSCEKKKGKGAT